ncbi:MAG: hypothetical protein H6Q27_1161, partial [Ignavibacteriaceae bacterium]|nr:hypothetical protein [Ignavibacteriaceae bacterium]
MMNRLKKIKSLFCILLELSYIILLFFFLNENVFAGDNPEKKVKKWALSLSIKPYYDSNILKYSEKYIERFKNLEDEGRFHIETTDDLVWGYSIGLTYTDEIIGSLKTILGAGYDSDAYTYNSIKTWLTYNVFLRQYITASTSVSASYSYLPSFYVRHFRDEDWVKYYGYVPET